MKRRHFFELVLEKKIKSSTDKIVHQSRSSECVTETTGLFTEWVEEVINDEFFGHSEGFGVAILDTPSNTEEKAYAEGWSNSEGNLVSKIIAWEELSVIGVSLLSGHLLIDLI